MTKQLLFIAVSSTAACVSPPSASTADQAVSDNACPDNVPSALAPAADQDLAFTLNASGSQIYQCNAAGTGWTFFAPDAMLFPHDPSEIVGHHYAGPTWEYEDGSLVVGKKVAAATPDTTAIPWLLLVAASHGAVEGRMSDITSIQRLVTVGGLSPTGACTPNAFQDVPYTATYFFYRTSPNNPDHNTRCGA